MECWAEPAQSPSQVCARIRSMLVMMSVRRSIGTSEGIDCLRLCARPHVGPKTIALRYVHVTAHNLFEVRRDSCVRKKVLREIWREVDEQIHVAVCSILISYN